MGAGNFRFNSSDASVISTSPFHPSDSKTTSKYPKDLLPQTSTPSSHSSSATAWLIPDSFLLFIQLYTFFSTLSSVSFDLRTFVLIPQSRNVDSGPTFI